MNLDRQAWIDRARAVPIMHEIERRGIKLKRVGAEYIGPSPLCGGTALLMPTRKSGTAAAVESGVTLLTSFSTSTAAHLTRTSPR